MVELVPPDPSWPAEYERAAAELADIVPADWPIEHIGSTSVPGLIAKPIIDLGVRVPALAAVVELDPQLRSAGWHQLARGPVTHLVRVKESEGRRTHIAHFFAAEDWEHCHQRVFRDWLQDLPEDRDRYAEAKRSAAAAAEDGRDYTLRKRAVVEEITNRARTARGLPAVEVWDK